MLNKKSNPVATIRRVGIMTVFVASLASLSFAFSLTVMGHSPWSRLSDGANAIATATVEANDVDSSATETSDREAGLASLFSADSRSDSRSSGDDEAAQAAQFVQENTGRSAFRPNFSSNSRASHQRSNFFMLRAFDDAIGDSWKPTVQLLDDSQQLAYGVIVRPDGWIVTKASEMPSNGTFVCRLYDGSEVAAELVASDDELDLALLHIARNDLPVITWDESYQPRPGRWLATTDTRAGLPSAVGVVSAGAQRIRRSKAVLGVHLVDSSEGAAITMVLRGSGADAAGLKIGDSIYEVNGVEVNTRDGFLEAIHGSYGGQIVELSVNRAEKKFQTEARLMDLANELMEETEMEVNGRISSRSTGFEQAFLHDTVLDPRQCGGPLVNLDGMAVGLNIARAGRVTSLALPASVVKPAIDNMIQKATLVSKPVESPSKLRKIR